VRAPAANASSTTADVVAALEARSIKPARKVLAFDTGVLAGATAAPRIPGWVGATAKQEGVLALGDCVVAIGDDDDFGLGLNPQSQLNIVRLPTCITQLYKVGRLAEGEAVAVLHIVVR
jgi:hypothetical protein